MDELQQLGVSVLGGTVEDRETAAGMAEELGLSFPIAYGVTPDSVESLAPWWTKDERHGRYLQPMEFLLRRGVVLGSMYASGPIGRMDVEEATAFIRNRERRKRPAVTAICESHV